MKNTTQGVPPVETAWDSEDTARYLKISVRHLSDLRVDDPTFPQPRMLGTLPRWEPSTVKRWLAGDDNADAHQVQHPVAKRRAKRTAAHHV